MTNLSPTEKEYFEELFGMKSGYVMDFTNAEFARFFKDTVGNDIYDFDYENYGGSKANRMRSWWEQESDEEVGTVLDAMLELWVFGEEKKGNDPDDNPIYKRCRKVVNRLNGKPATVASEKRFLDKDFGEIRFENIDVEESVKPILEGRLNEAKRGLEANNPLSVIFMCGSILEGLLLAVAQKNPKQFNTCKVSPKDGDGKVLPFNKWSLSQFIDVANNLGYLDIDTQKFSHVLRDFRNYIHPFEEMKSGFTPSTETAKICLQVLRAAIKSFENKDGSTIVEIYDD